MQGGHVAVWEREEKIDENKNDIINRLSSGVSDISSGDVVDGVLRPSNELLELMNDVGFDEEGDDSDDAEDDDDEDED